MSTKIYNGYIFDGDISEAIDHFDRKRPEVYDISAQVSVKLYAVLTSRLIDKAMINHEEARSPLGQVSDDISERRKNIKLNGRRDSAVDLESSATLIKTNDKVLVLVFSEQPEIYKALVNELRPYQFWDNSDKPDAITEEEWEKRRDVWNAALDKDPYSRPAGCGVIVDFMISQETPDVDLITANMPSKEERADFIMQGIIAADLISDSDDNPTISVMRALSDYKVLVASERWKQRKEDIKASLIDIDPDVLLEGVHSLNQRIFS